MKLFYSPGTCALASHITMAELGMVYEIEAVSLKDKTYASGDFNLINPKGSVPALKMDNGEILTENAIICQYLADQFSEKNLLAKPGTLERTRTLEWMNFISTEIHKNFSPLFFASRFFKSAETQNEVKDFFKNTLATKMSFINEKLGSHNFLMGEKFTIADAYLFTCLNWSKLVGIDLSQWSGLNSYVARISERPAVVKAMKEEGLIK